MSADTTYRVRSRDEVHQEDEMSRAVVDLLTYTTLHPFPKRDEPGAVLRRLPGPTREVLRRMTVEDLERNFFPAWVMGIKPDNV